jgi:hypothetical protein
MPHRVRLTPECQLGGGGAQDVADRSGPGIGYGIQSVLDRAPRPKTGDEEVDDYRQVADDLVTALPLRLLTEPPEPAEQPDGGQSAGGPAERSVDETRHRDSGCCRRGQRWTQPLR